MGLVNQLADFTTKISSSAEPLRPLLRPQNIFIWDEVHQRAFEEVKAALVEPPVLAHFDPTLPTRLETDASKLKGLGFVLRQQHEDGWRLVQCGSRFITDTEARYAVIELEMLGVVWAVKKLRVFLQGLPSFEIMVDHRPLVPILNQYTLDQVENLRLQRLKEKLQTYSFTASWQCGKDHALADALSRAPVSDPSPEDCLAEAKNESAVSFGIRKVASNLVGSSDPTDPYLQEIKMLAEDDPEYQELIGFVTAGFPSSSKDLPAACQPFWKERDNLSLIDGLVLRCGKQIVIPKKMRQEMLVSLHSSHQGIERTKRRARDSVFWPGISSDIKSTVEACYECQLRLPSQQQESYHTDYPHPDLARPFADVSADLFYVEGHTYLVYVDRYSGWPMVYSWNKDPTAAQVVRAITGFFHFGVPIRFRSDNGRQFDSQEFREFLSQWKIQAAPSSPEYPQSNGHAESGVKSMKYLISKLHVKGDIRGPTFFSAYLEYLNTPKMHGRSPAQLVFGRPTRTGQVPLHPCSVQRWPRS
jgi:transposase InsO family protein